MNPKVFISHASEDKERFVKKFTEKLRQKGIDAWVDEWEINPGDSLVKKIFDEGIKKAECMIIILSKNSVNKPWVREELDAGVIKKINKKMKLIPIIIEECEIPECLKATCYERINDFENYDNEFERIVNSIFEYYDKPPLGEAPKYTKTIIDNFPGLNKIDSIILKLACEKAIENGFPFIETDALLESLNTLNINKKTYLESLNFLDEKGYIKAEHVLGGEIPIFTITVNGFEKFAITYIENYDSIIKLEISEIINNGNRINHRIAENIKQPQMIVDHILNILNYKSLISISENTGGEICIGNVSVQLRRFFNNL